MICRAHFFRLSCLWFRERLFLTALYRILFLMTLLSGMTPLVPATADPIGARHVRTG